jgi:hypothetical protein
VETTTVKATPMKTATSKTTASGGIGRRAEAQDRGRSHGHHRFTQHHHFYS